MGDLSQKKCIPCSASSTPLKGSQLKPLMDQLGEGWNVVQEHHLEKEYLFKNFREALAFTNDVGVLAEKEGHHPDILLRWGKVKLTFFTHKIDGLSENDFVMAAKCEAVYLAKYAKKSA